MVKSLCKMRIDGCSLKNLKQKRSLFPRAGFFGNFRIKSRFPGKIFFLGSFFSIPLKFGFTIFLPLKGFFLATSKGSGSNFFLVPRAMFFSTLEKVFFAGVDFFLVGGLASALRTRFGCFSKSTASNSTSSERGGFLFSLMAMFHAHQNGNSYNQYSTQQRLKGRDFGKKNEGKKDSVNRFESGMEETGQLNRNLSEAID